MPKTPDPTPNVPDTSQQLMMLQSDPRPRVFDSPQHPMMIQPDSKLKLRFSSRQPKMSKPDPQPELYSSPRRPTVPQPPHPSTELRRSLQRPKVSQAHYQYLPLGLSDPHQQLSDPHQQLTMPQAHDRHLLQELRHPATPRVQDPLPQLRSSVYDQQSTMNEQNPPPYNRQNLAYGLLPFHPLPHPSTNPATPWTNSPPPPPPPRIVERYVYRPFSHHPH